MNTGTAKFQWWVTSTSITCLNGWDRPNRIRIQIIPRPRSWQVGSASSTTPQKSSYLSLSKAIGTMGIIRRSSLTYGFTSYGLSISCVWCTIMYEDWKSYTRTLSTETAVSNRLKGFEVPLAWRITNKAHAFPSTTKKTEFDIQAWNWSECIEFHLCSMGRRPFSITDSLLDFVDEPNDGGGKDPVGRRLRPRNSRSKLTSNFIPNCSNNKRGLLWWFWISGEKSTYKQLTVKFPESSSEMFIKRHFMNIGEWRFRKFDG
jgi:hypothetical protein